jgi:tRNA A37 N6-isopentenylltransferase MiaA
MLGADSRYKKKQWGFRNHFCASVGTADDIELKEMEKLGLVKHRQYDKNQVYYFATKKGAVQIGFKPYQLKNTRLSE